MGELLTPTHLMVVAAVVIIFFGGKKISELGKGLGEGLRGFRDGMKGMTKDLNDHETVPASAINPEPPTI
ncbi:MAG: twin-arginine translocase TatA/TatE family subunit [Terracidiphilus sp.]|jgi:sec-independent protein translocase protein TatA